MPSKYRPSFPPPSLFSLHLVYIHNTYPPLPDTTPQGRTPDPSSSSTHHQSTSLAFSSCPLSSCALASANHASALFHPLPNLVRLERRPYALSLAARRSTQGMDLALYAGGRGLASDAPAAVPSGPTQPLGAGGMVLNEAGFLISLLNILRTLVLSPCPEHEPLVLVPSEFDLSLRPKGALGRALDSL